MHACDLHDQSCIVIAFSIDSRNADPAAERAPVTRIELRPCSGCEASLCVASAQHADDGWMEILREEKPEWILATG
jgi:hypothetical protein